MTTVSSSDSPSASTPAEDDRWYSDAALAKQAEARNYPPGTHPPLTLLLGLLEPRVPPTVAEQCCHCNADARDRAGGEQRGDRRYCGLCIGRGYDEDGPA